MTRLTQLRLGWNADADGVGRARPARHRRSDRQRSCRPLVRVVAPPMGRRPCRPRSRWPSTRDTLGQLLFVRCDTPARRPDGPVPRGRDHRHPPRQERELPVGADAEHVQHGPALRARLRRSDRVQVAAPRRLRRPRRRRSAASTARPARSPRASRCWATPVMSRHASAPRFGRKAARSSPARGDLPAVPAGRQVRLLQLAADVVPRFRREGRSTRPWTTRITASRISRSSATCWPTCARS